MKVKKILAACLAMSIVLCFAVTGFAATYTTTTVYNLDELETVTITSEASGLTEGEQVTYLAYANSVADENIIYINQDAAKADGTVSFSYTTTVGKIGTGTTAVKFGAKNDTVTPVEGTESDKIASTKVDVTATNATVTVNGIDVSNGFKVGLNQEVDFAIAAESGFEITSLKVNGAEISDLTPATFKLATAGVASPSIEVVAAGNETTEITAESQVNDLTSATVAERAVTTFAKVTVPAEQEATAEYGIIVLKSSGAAPTEEQVKTLGTKYKAYGKGSNGMYAVKLIGGGATFESGEEIFADGQQYSVLPYLTTSAGTIYGALQSFGVNE